MILADIRKSLYITDVPKIIGRGDIYRIGFGKTNGILKSLCAYFALAEMGKGVGVYPLHVEIKQSASVYKCLVRIPCCKDTWALFGRDALFYNGKLWSHG